VYSEGLAAVRSAAAEAGRSAGAVVPGLFASIAVTGSVASGRRLLAEFSQANYGMPVEQLETTLAAQREQLEQLIKLKPLLTTG
jgi:hypothetical protein